MHRHMVSGGEEWCVMRLAVLARVEFIAMARKRYDLDVIAQNIAVRISAQAHGISYLVLL